MSENSKTSKLPTSLAIAVREEAVDKILSIAYKSEIRLVPVLGAWLTLTNADVNERLRAELPIDFIVTTSSFYKLVTAFVVSGEIIIEKDYSVKYRFSVKVKNITVMFDVYGKSEKENDLILPTKEIVNSAKYKKDTNVWMPKLEDCYFYMLWRLYHSRRLSGDIEFKKYLNDFVSEYNLSSAKLILLAKFYGIKKFYLAIANGKINLINSRFPNRYKVRTIYSDSILVSLVSASKKLLNRSSKYVFKNGGGRITSVLRPFAVNRESARMDTVDALVTGRPSQYDLPIEVSNTYLVGTTTGLWLLSKNRMKRIRTGTTFGITKMDGRWFSCQYTGEFSRIKSFLMIDSGEAYDSIEERTFIGGLPAGVHQIDSFQDSLYIINTHRNSLMIKDGNGILKEYFPNKKIRKKKKRYNHFNSVFIDKENIYLMAHNGPMRPKINSEIYVLDRDSKKLKEKIETKGRLAHNIVKLTEKFMYCNSPEGELIYDNKVIFKDANFFLRGISVTDKNILVGGSQFAKRSIRNRTDGKLFLLNRDGKLECEICLPKIGQIFDVRAINSDVGLSQG